MVRIIIDASALSAQQRIDYTAELDRNMGIANPYSDNPLYIDLYTDHPEKLILPPGAKVVSRHG